MGGRDTKPRAAEQGGQPFESDWSGSDQPTTDIVEAVAEATGKGVHELDPIQDYVDGDALETLLTDGSTDVTTTFVYDGVTVQVHSDGSIAVWPE